jgi:SulP family sulfate permease
LSGPEEKMSTEEGYGSEEGIARFFPVVSWLPRYHKGWFSFDLLAAITVAAFAVPNLMAFSQLAGLPPK